MEIGSDINESFVNFSNAIIKEAIAEKENFMQKIIKQREEIIKNKQTEISSKIDFEINCELQKLKNESISVISSKKIKLRKKILTERTKLCDEVINEVIKKIIDFSKKDNYVNYLELNIEKCSKLINLNNIDEILVKDSDTQKIKNILNKFCQLNKMKITIADSSIIGGFIIKSLETNIILDCSLKNEIEKHKKYFSNMQELILIFDF
ncbi:MAG: hypothetical protein LBJ09_03420 [Clostridiales bacterium]|nr:hypothetical protein [Clostridiales bacterium]